MRKLWIPLAILAAVMVATSLVSRRDRNGAAPGGADTAATRAHQDQLYVEVSMLGSIDYFYDHKMGMDMAGRILGVRTEYVGPAGYDIAAMVTAFEQALSRQGLKGIVVVGFEEALVPVIDKAVARGIPVVTVDADLPQSKRVAFVGTGNHRAGLEGGRTLARLLGGQGKVALLTRTGQSNLEERIQGYRDALAAFPAMSIVQVADTQSDPVVAAQVATSVLQRTPDLAAIACVEAAGGVGAATAVREAGLVGKVRIVAMDRGNDIVQLIQDGVIDASVAQQTALMPVYAVQILYTLANYPIPVTSDNAAAGVSGAPAIIDTGVVIVDKSNCQYFLRK